MYSIRHADSLAVDDSEAGTIVNRIHQRYIAWIFFSDWTSVATISTRKDIQSFPTVNVISFSDGPLGNGSGTPYMYLTPLDFTAQDTAVRIDLN